jgi:hypothetical protein
VKKISSAFIALLIAITPSATAAAQTTFYLDLKVGCYSASKIPSKPVKWSNTDYKTLYSASCIASHHYEVFKVAKLKAKDLASTAARDEASGICTEAARNLIGTGDVADTLTYAYFYPDKGAEEKKYGKKLICFFRILDPKDSGVSLSVNKPAVIKNYV